MNEAETRAELIDPKLREAGWGVLEGTKISREYHITRGRLRAGGREKPMIADYILNYKGRQLAVIEAKSDELSEREGVAQAKEYAGKLELKYAYASNGKKIYQMHLGDGEVNIERFPTPDELWQKVVTTTTEWEERFNPVPLEDMGRQQVPRYYQELAINKTLEAIANGKERILLTLATGTGKTTIAFHIIWKLYQTRWNLRRDASRLPRVLFLADRNILANQAFSEFTRYAPQLDNAMVRIRPNEIRKRGRVPTNGSIFFTIFQTFMASKEKDKDGKPIFYFGEYPKDFFDFIVIDECHRGGANDESQWRGILDYFSPAVQLGLTATPKRDVNVDTYDYFGKPVFTYSLRDGINDGYLTPYKVRRITTDLDEYTYQSDDSVIEGEIEEGKTYTEAEFNRTIEIEERERLRVKLFMDEINPNEKTIVFCATQAHAAFVRDLINQYKGNTDPGYCVRVTANDGELGEQYLSQFQDNERMIPTILTTSQKLSTGVDARNLRNVVLMRPVNSMVEFKQIIGRGTRLFTDKEFFTIYDFVGAYHHFHDEGWDGPPEEPPITEPRPPCPRCGQKPCICEKEPPRPCPECGESPCVCEKKVKIKLADGKEREIQHATETMYYDVDGRPITAQQFMEKLYGKLPEFFKDETDLRRQWSNPETRQALLEKLASAGYGMEQLRIMQRLVNAENSDIFDVLEYVRYLVPPIARITRVAQAQSQIFAGLTAEKKQFVEFVLAQYIQTGIEELSQDKLPDLLKLKYAAIADAQRILGDIPSIRELFIGFQRMLYVPQGA
jgi:type I restriction enzyme R subunit